MQFELSTFICMYNYVSIYMLTPPEPIKTTFTTDIYNKNHTFLVDYFAASFPEYIHMRMTLFTIYFWWYINMYVL